VIVPAVQGILRWAKLNGRRALGLRAQLDSEDRRVLEQIILPVYAARATPQRVLFVGCAPYTQHYGELFAAHEYWTIDPVASMQRYGSRRHIVDGLHHLGSHIQPEYFNVIVCNGVLGWGLNAPEQVEAAFGACHRHLQAEGELIVGWNDVAPRNNVSPDNVAALRLFRAAIFQPLGTFRYPVAGANRHVFDFYVKEKKSYKTD